MTVTLVRGDAAHLPLPDGSVDLVVTSPPYFALRSYQDNGSHYAGQIGSEATPAEFIDALIACTREWVRVLKPSGSLWVNLGDSYAGSSGGGPPSASSTLAGNGHIGGGPKLTSLTSAGPVKRAGRRGQRDRRSRIEQFTREDAAWLAGVVDSDGSIGIHVNQQSEGRSPSFVPWVRVGQMRPEVVNRIAEIVGTGRVMQDGRGVWHWTASAQQARWVLERIHPWLLIKKRQAWAAVEVARHVEDRNARGSWRPLTDDDVAYRQRLRDAVVAWNQGERDDCSVPEPERVSLPIYPFAPGEKSLRGIPWEYANRCIGELGLILRAEVIWSKPNGLPESVTDRVRRSHEQWFHLTKQPRYYAAVDTIREPGTGRIGLTYEERQRNGARTYGDFNAHTSGGPGMATNPLGKLPGSVWSIPSQPLTVPPELGVDHFAAFPMELPRRIIQGWSPSGICTRCGEGRRPVSVKTGAVKTGGGVNPELNNHPLTRRPGRARQDFSANTLGWTPQFAITGEVCDCVTPLWDDEPSVGGESCQQADLGTGSVGTAPPTLPPTRPAVVLDPFGGTGTTALMADVLGRHGISVDMSADYCRLAAWRTTDPGERARAMQVEKPEAVSDGQMPLFA